MTTPTTKSWKRDPRSWSVVTETGSPVADVWQPEAIDLIVAAPDLLAVCEGLVAWWKADGISGNSATDALADAARAAVAKAKGTKP